MEKRVVLCMLLWVLAAELPSVAYATYVVPFEIFINGKRAFTGSIDGGSGDRLTDIIRRLADEPLEVRNHFNLDSGAPDGVTLKGDVEFMLLDLPPVRLDHIRLVYDRAPLRNSFQSFPSQRYGWRLHRDDASEIIAQLERFLASESFKESEKIKAKVSTKRLESMRLEAKEAKENAQASTVAFCVTIVVICLGTAIGFIYWNWTGREHL